MSKTTYYRQCKLRKGNSYQTSWIPERFAVKDKVLKLRQEGVWDDGWVVVEAGSNRLADEMLPDSHEEIKSHRKATGDSAPKKK